VERSGMERRQGCWGSMDKWRWWEVFWGRRWKGKLELVQMEWRIQRRGRRVMVWRADVAGRV